MKDIMLNFADSKLVNEYIDKKPRIVQQITVACRSWAGDFFLNQDFGVDYDSSWGNMQLMELYIKQQVAQIPGVSSIVKSKIRREKGADLRDKFIVDLQLVYNQEEIVISDLILGR